MGIPVGVKSPAKLTKTAAKMGGCCGIPCRLLANQTAALGSFYLVFKLTNFALAVETLPPVVLTITLYHLPGTLFRVTFFRTRMQTALGT